jgi:hypothetical protein
VHFRKDINISKEKPPILVMLYVQQEKFVLKDEDADL